MKILIEIAVITAFVIGNILIADVLVVTKKGESIWAITASKDNDIVSYVRREDGVEIKCSASELDGVLPVFKRGVSYSTNEGQKYIERIQKVRAKHPALMKQLNGILQEWENLLKADPEMEKKIYDAREEFYKSDKGPKAYRKLSVDLNMLQYKDMQGKYSAKIKEIIDQAKKEFVAVNKPKITALAAGGKVDVKTFLPIKIMGEELMQATEGAEKEEIKNAVEKSRAICLESGINTYSSAFTSARSLDAYLQSSAGLWLLRREVASSEQQITKIEKAIQSLISNVSNVFPKYDFSFRGFPLLQDEIRQFNNAGSKASRVTFADVLSENSCILIPMKEPGVLRLHNKFTIPLKAIFNQAQPADRIYGMIIQMHQKGGGLFQYSIKLPSFVITEGRATFSLEDDFSKLDGHFVLGPSDTDGNSFYFCCLAYLIPANDFNPQDEWRALSSFCAWRVLP